MSVFYWAEKLALALLPEHHKLGRKVAQGPGQLFAVLCLLLPTGLL